MTEPDFEDFYNSVFRLARQNGIKITRSELQGVSAPEPSAKIIISITRRKDTIKGAR